MKIMFFLTDYGIGGASAVARNLLDSFSEDKFELIVMTEKLSERHYSLNDSIRVIDLKLMPRKGMWDKLINIRKHLKNIRTQIRKEQPDAVISFGSQANCGLLFSLLFKRKKPKIIITEHSEEMFLKRISGCTRYNISKKVYRFLMFCLYRRADYVVAVSIGISEKIRKTFFIKRLKLRAIYNPIDINKTRRLSLENNFLKDSREALPTIGTVSRLSPEKGVSFLIEAFAELAKDTNVRLIIVGDGLERLKLEKIAGSLGVKEKVLFTGWADNPFRYIGIMDVFILPSLWEGFPNVILEAMACGIPVIASDCSSGIREIIKDGFNGVLIKPGSSAAISKATRELLNNKEKRQKIISEAFRTVKQVDKDKIKEQYKCLILN
jgi:glycosyltransferase involved in cell wall biosynthesis